mgnify:CR=1 FL=1|jgi:hypothetical protein
MKISFIIILLITSINNISAQEKNVKLSGNEILTIEIPETGKIENGVYTCYLFDWKITIPENYKITDVKITEELENKGYEATKSANPNIKVNPHPTQLVGFEKDKYTYFKSSFESLAGTKKVTLEEHKKFSEQMLTDTYSNIKQLKFEISSSDIKIGKYSFYKIEIRIYNPKDETLLLTQQLYNSFINNDLFSASINYRSVEDGMTLNYVFKKSMEN